MGEVRTEITLVNIEDQSVAGRGYMPQDQVRWLTVDAAVDTSAWTMVINEATREKLGLRISRTDSGTLAGGTNGIYNLMNLIVHPLKQEVIGAHGDQPLHAIL